MKCLILPALTLQLAWAQFIPDKPVTIHPAIESTPERKGEIKGPGDGLGKATPAPPPAGRGGAGRAGRGPASPPPIPPPPPAPEITPAGAGVEQKSQGTRPAIAPGASFDGLGVGFSGGESGRGGRGG